MDYFVYKNNQNIGPLAESEVINGIRSRRFLLTDLGCRVGQTEWKDLSFFFPLEVSQPAQQPPVLRQPHYQQPHDQTQPIGSNPYQHNQMQPVAYAPLAGNPYQNGNYELGPRVLALVIDGLIAIPLFILAVVPFVGIVGAPLACLYYVSRDAIFGGQSVGKRAMGLRVIKEDGSPFTWADSAKRNIIYFAFLLLMIPWVGLFLHGIVAMPLAIVELIMVISGGQRIGDRMGNTYVVKA